MADEKNGSVTLIDHNPSKPFLDTVLERNDVEEPHEIIWLRPQLAMHCCKQAQATGYTTDAYCKANWKWSWKNGCATST